MEARRLVMVMGFQVPVKRNFDIGKDPEENFALDRDRGPNHLLPEKAVDPGTDSAPEKFGSSGDSLSLVRAKELAREVSPENNGKPGGNFSSNTAKNSGDVLGLEKVRGPDNGFAFAPAPSSVRISDLNGAVIGKLNMSSIVHEVSVVLNTSSTGKQEAKALTEGENTGPVQGVSASPSDNSTVATMPILLRQGEPPIAIPEMNHFLLWNGTSLSPMKPLWSSASDQELSSTKLQIENAPAVKNDHELYAPVFRNVSQFKRGTHVSLYLSHLVFAEGAVKALIHQMENCERSRVEIFVHGGKARCSHRFQMPKWVPLDGTAGCKDVSLPATRVRTWQIQNPLKDLGGKPASERPTLAFFAGNMHGKIRRILLQYWENKDPNMKIFGPMPLGADGKIAYINYMKTSKYCICPRGYSVYSPRVVEAIYYECVPVIISDDYVPPFFEVLNWETFSVFVAEKDIPTLKDILLSIPEERYLTIHLTVKKVQQHFLWHSKPVKYDIFHMILHSIWFNRLHQLRTS
ncbi:hypothetical protein AAC387_Pa03g4567 [Persea americana]